MWTYNEEMHDATKVMHPNRRLHRKTRSKHKKINREDQKQALGIIGEWIKDSKFHKKIEEINYKIQRNLKNELQEAEK